MLGPLDHVAVAGGVDDEVGGEFCPVGEHDGFGGDALDSDAGPEFDVSVDDEFGSADIDVVPGAAAGVFHAYAGFIYAEVEKETGSFEPGVEVRVGGAGLVGGLLPSDGGEGVDFRGGHEVSDVGSDTGGDSGLGVVANGGAIATSGASNGGV